MIATKRWIGVALGVNLKHLDMLAMKPRKDVIRSPKTF